ncbi:MAG: prephenate dehydrogenase/arogenate dehydrogenase family protein [Anaerolineales bacterium]|nr:prephenate dehydrogenase/arogenate dehydrogenase family protein [Anaerolineales bacterium]
MQITILGLGQIGSSIGLCLSEHKSEIKRVGLDRHVHVARQARKMDAVDEIKVNLGTAVRKADIVILAMPSDQVKETLEVIADELQEDTVVLDTSPIRATATDWASGLLPSGCSYVGLTPIINPAYLLDHESGVDAARADLFERGIIAIAAGRGIPESAIKAATGLTKLLGAAPLFADIAEVDGIMAAVHVLPQLSAAAVLDATLDQPGWQESRKFAGRAYVTGTSAVKTAFSGEALRDSAILNAENITRLLDRMMASLQKMRDYIAEQDVEALGALLHDLETGREDWLVQRESANWIVERPELPETPGLMAQMFGFKPRPKPGEKR